MLMKFTKMHGLGNDFVVIDAVTQNVHVTAAMAKRLSDRHLGIGCDQVLVVEPPSDKTLDFDYKIFNSDGGEVGQCGNGARCLARFIRDRRLSGKETVQVKTMNRVISLTINKDKLVSVDMGIPGLEPSDVPFVESTRSSVYAININNEQFDIAAISMGNPHAVLFVDNLDRAPVNVIGQELQSHDKFPKQVNVGFAQIINRQHLKLRVYERGVGETRACGTGACAAAVAAIQQGLMDSAVRVELTGGDLHINWPGEGQPLIMTGSAVTSYQGRIKI
ncbi:MAG: diaminopimelate epimerase [Porticoccaceae bacterium]|jgi:diaminopimelate epimerase|nr:diaminopimelate epimerase [Porticoccaceae bacterium]MBT3798911.1 diaminopimelate epimerase [Porticoccaceae bacterium]MBT4164832.1 diaminopimelate epimerase [Porticoccaceae bacterium]MBT4211493.1 diaminopimelate epimerase [Porticoccaceae bacterium]MBT4590759.1 diaminopimelate epimerase [Porticoccaceae bacterium]